LLREKLSKLKDTCDSLKDEIRDKQELANEMTEKADEYERAIDLMQADFEKQLAEERAHC